MEKFKPGVRTDDMNKPYEPSITGTTNQSPENVKPLVGLIQPSHLFEPTRDCIVKAPLQIKVKGEIDGEHKTYVTRTDGKTMSFITEGYGIGTSYEEIREFLEFLEISYVLEGVFDGDI